MSDTTCVSRDGQDDASPCAGYALNEYRIERVLGGGGFGITYLAHDTHLDCRVAIKEYVPKDLARGKRIAPCAPLAGQGRRGSRGLQRFLLEAGPGSFHHPGIVRVLRYFRPTKPPTW
jgi:serine/threonine protein kinase